MPSGRTRRDLVSSIGYRLSESAIYSFRFVDARDFMVAERTVC